MTPTERSNLMRECIKMVKELYPEGADADTMLKMAKDIYEFLSKEK